MTDLTDTKFGPKYFLHTDLISGPKPDNKKDVSIQNAPGGPKDLSYCHILNWIF